MRRWPALIAIAVAVILLVLAQTRRVPQIGARNWQDPRWDIYDEIASGPAD